MSGTERVLYLLWENGGADSLKQEHWAYLGAVHGTQFVFGVLGACGGVTDGWYEEEAAAQLRTSTILWAALHGRTSTAHRALWDDYRLTARMAWSVRKKIKRSCVVYLKEMRTGNHRVTKRERMSCMV